MKALIELYAELESMYAYHVEMGAALLQWHKGLAKANKGSSTRVIFFGNDDPNKPDAKFQYSKLASRVIAESAENGAHSNMFRRTVIAMTYSIWEDQYRRRIAYECGLKSKNDVKSDVFQDVNRYRQAVLHAGGRLVSAPKVIHFFEHGEEVLLTKDHMYELFTILISELNRIGQEYYAQDPGFSLDRPLKSG